MKVKVLAFAAVFCMAASSCGSGQSSSSETVALSAVRGFPDVQVPGIYEADEAVEYLAAHYWDAFADTSKSWLCDSSHVNGVATADLEQAFSNYAYALDLVPFDMAQKCLRGLYATLASLRPCERTNIFEGMLEIAERYLYDPNSPVRNEDYWQPLAKALSEDPMTAEAMRGSYAYQAETAAINRVGTRAADFRFCDARGKTHRLYDVRAEYTLLFFSNPGCTACKEIIDRLDSDLKVEWLLSEGILAVVNVYIDEDIDSWREYMPTYPDSWHNGYDPDFTIRSSLLYNVRAIPSVYILDAEKTVLMKDAPESKVFEFIENI